MERKKRSKGRGWESCYVKKIYGTFGVEMRAYGQKFVKFCRRETSYTLLTTKLMMVVNKAHIKRMVRILLRALLNCN